MTDDRKQNLVSKIKKLFDLADPTRGGTEAEVELAMQRARSLMAKYNLTMSEIQFQSKDDLTEQTITIEEHLAHHQRGNVSLRKWEMWLGSVVDVVCTTTHFYRTQNWGREKHCRLFFVGDGTDAQVAGALWSIFRSSILKQARRYLGKGYSPAHRNYSEGFVLRMYERVQETNTVSEQADLEMGLTKDDKEVVALMVVSKKSAIEQWREQQGFRKRRRSSSFGSYDSDAYQKGYEDGGKINLSKDNMLNGGK